MVRELTELLFVGDAEDAQRYENDVDVIVSMACPPRCSTKQYLISDGSHKYKLFASAVDYVMERLSENESVLVHCQAGISRSVSVCIAVCVCYYGMKFEEAYDRCTHDTFHPSDELLNSAKRYTGNLNAVE